MKKNKKKVKLFRIERMLIKFCLILLVTFPVVNVLSKAALSNMNLEVEKLKKWNKQTKKFKWKFKHES